MSRCKPNSETIKLVRHNLFGYIRDFADAETQNRRWLDYIDTNPFYTFAECMCHYFDDAVTDGGLEEMLEDGFISSAELTALTPFHVLANAYHAPTDDYDHVTILRDPEWHRVQCAALQCCARLLEVIDDQTEATELRIQRKQEKVGMATPRTPLD